MALRFNPERGVILPATAAREFSPRTFTYRGISTRQPAYITRTMAIAVESVMETHQMRGMEQKLVAQFGPTIRRGREEIAANLTVNDKEVMLVSRRNANITYTMPNYLIRLRGGLAVTYTVDGVDYRGTLEPYDSTPKP